MCFSSFSWYVVYQVVTLLHPPIERYRDLLCSSNMYVASLNSSKVTGTVSRIIYRVFADRDLVIIQEVCLFIILSCGVFKAHVVLKCTHSCICSFLWFIVMRENHLMMIGLSSFAILSPEFFVCILRIPGVLADIVLVVFVLVEIENNCFGIVLVPPTISRNVIFLEGSILCKVLLTFFVMEDLELVDSQS